MARNVGVSWETLRLQTRKCRPRRLRSHAFNAERAHDTVRICNARLSAIRVDADSMHFVRLSPRRVSPWSVPTRWPTLGTGSGNAKRRERRMAKARQVEKRGG